MNRFWKIVLLIGVVFAINLVIRVPHPTRHHRTLLPPKTEAPAWDEDDPPVKVVVTPPKMTRPRSRATMVAPVVTAIPSPPPVPAWQVTGEACETKQEAWQSALEK